MKDSHVNLLVVYAQACMYWNVFIDLVLGTDGILYIITNQLLPHIVGPWVSDVEVGGHLLAISHDGGR